MVKLASLLGGLALFITTGNYSSYASQCFINLPFINVTHDSRPGLETGRRVGFGLNKLFRNNITLLAVCL